MMGKETLTKIVKFMASFSRVLAFGEVSSGYIMNVNYILLKSPSPVLYIKQTGLAKGYD